MKKLLSLRVPYRCPMFSCMDYVSCFWTPSPKELLISFISRRQTRGMVGRIRLRGRNRGGMKKDLNLFLLSSCIDLELRFFHSRQFEYWIAKMTISASKCCTFHYDRTCQFDEGKNLIQFCWLPTTRTRVSVHTNQFRTQVKILQARQVERPLLGRFSA